MNCLRRAYRSEQNQTSPQNEVPFLLFKNDALFMKQKQRVYSQSVTNRLIICVPTRAVCTSLRDFLFKLLFENVGGATFS